MVGAVGLEEGDGVETVGDAEGLVVGASVGLTVGASVGLTVGAPVGLWEGLEVGGSVVGTAVGRLVNQPSSLRPVKLKLCFSKRTKSY